MVSIIITCGPGYDRWVADAVGSAMIQGPGIEIIVVYDRCAPPREWKGVIPVSIDSGNVHTARWAGYEKSTGDAVLFLDADDLLPWGYVNSATTQLVAASAADKRVMGIYPSAEYSDIATGETIRRWTPPEWDVLVFECENFLLISTLVWREALRSAFTGTYAHNQLEDYAMWRSVVDAGGVFQRGEHLSLHVRTHATSLTNALASRDYAQSHDLRSHTNTLFAVVSDLPGAVRLAKWLPYLPAATRVAVCVIGGNDLYSQVAVWLAAQHTDLRVFRGVDARAEQSKAVYECPTAFITLVSVRDMPDHPPDLTSGFEGDVAAVGWIGTGTARDTAYIPPHTIMARTKALRQIITPITSLRVWRDLVAAGWRVREI